MQCYTGNTQTYTFQISVQTSWQGPGICIKYLGINLSHDSRWNHHVNAITTKANKTLIFLRRNLRTCSAKSREQAHKALVTDCWIQCHCLGPLRSYKNIQQYWNDSTPSSLHNCWVHGRYNRWDSVTDMLTSLNSRSLELRWSEALLCMLYKQCNELATYNKLLATSFRENIRAD